jgi:hypothetical protein
MNGKLAIAVILFIALATVVWVYRGNEDHTIVFGESVPEKTFLDRTQPATEFAKFVENRLITELIQRFKIDVSDESIRAFIAQEAPELASQERTHGDQANVARIADALEAVIDGKGADEAYEEFGLQDAMDPESWKLMAINDANMAIVDSMRDFAGSHVPDIHRLSRESIRPIYINRSIKGAICGLPRYAERSNRRETDAHDNKIDQSNSSHETSGSYECAVVANEYILAELEKNVSFTNDALRGYEKHLQILDHVVIQITSQRP